MRDFTKDLRYSLRILAKAPVFAAVAVLSLALGIGANTAIFTLLDQLLLRLLPVKNPQELVLLSSRGSHYGSNRGGNALSYPMYEDFRDHNTVFSGVMCRFGVPLSMSFNGRTERVTGELVSGTYFQVLGVGAALGRVFTPEDDRIPNGHPLAVLSYGFWKTRFAGDPSILNKTIHINGYALTVIGVSQAGFDGVIPGEVVQVRVPVMMKARMTPQWDDLKDRRSRWVNVFARLKPEVTMQQARASLQPFYHQILEMEVKDAAFRNADIYTRQQFLLMQLFGILFFAATIPLSAVLAERHGRRATLLIVTAAIAAFGLVMAPLLVAGTSGALLTMTIGLALMGFTYGPLGTLLSELFPTAVRYTGSSLTFNLAGIVGASLAPYIATWLAGRYGLAYAGYYLTAAALLTLGALALTTETRDRTL